MTKSHSFIFKRFLPTLIAAIMLAGIVILPGAMASAASIKDGDLITFGYYPQSRRVNAPDIDVDTLSWQSYGYYSAYLQGTYMQYADVTIMGVDYRAVKFTSFRPIFPSIETEDCADGAGQCHMSYQDNSGFVLNQVYWFKYEPIAWRVIDASSGLIVAENIIDSQPYSAAPFVSNGTYWKNSDMKTWLNGTFADTAFTSKEKSYIKTSSLNTPVPQDGYFPSYSASSSDKIFLLSKEETAYSGTYWENKYKELYNPSNSWRVCADVNPVRIAYGTPYAKIQGLDAGYNPEVDLYGLSDYPGASSWYLRTPEDSLSGVLVISETGAVSSAEYNCTAIGIRPAMRINLSSAISAGVAATATDKVSLVEQRMSPPVIRSWTSQHGVTPGTEVSYSVDVDCIINCMYQWQVSTDGGKTWKDTYEEGYLSPKITLTATKDKNNYKYRCIIANPCGQVISSPANLFVAEPSVDPGAAVESTKAKFNLFSKFIEFIRKLLNAMKIFKI